MGLRGRFVFRDAARARKLCAGTTPLHRLYNNGQGGAPNHRYTTCTNLRDRMVANEGWVSEGVAMCVAGDSFDCKADTSIGLPPGPPIGLTVTPGNANVTLTFKPPRTDGGLPITSYTASCSSPGSVKTATNPASPITVRGLVNGVSNVCSVVATNEAGNGPRGADLCNAGRIQQWTVQQSRHPAAAHANHGRRHADVRPDARAFVAAIRCDWSGDRHVSATTMPASGGRRSS
jgi:hypothetical protein